MTSDPIQPPASATQPGALPWWVSTIAGILVPVLGTLALQLEAPWRDVLLAVAGALGAALGVSHSGALRFGPPRATP